MGRKLPNPSYKIEILNYITPCWLWLGCTRRGYALISNPNYSGTGKKMLQASIVFYEKYKTKIPEGLVLDHLCRNRHCVNPDHLEPVTQKINFSRGARANPEMKSSEPNHVFIRTKPRIRFRHTV